jgi:ELWxxDGT repeat protein
MGPFPNTSMLVDIDADAASSSPHNFQTLDGIVYFAITDASGNSQLRSSNGTAVGTALVKNFGSTAIVQIQANGGAIFIWAGNDLWRSDGTTAGTQILASPSGGLGGADHPIGHRSLFPAVDSTTGSEVWVSDGTPAGTHITKDIVPGSGGSNPSFPSLPFGQYYNLYNLPCLKRSTWRGPLAVGRHHGKDFHPQLGSHSGIGPWSSSTT